MASHLGRGRWGGERGPREWTGVEGIQGATACLCVDANVIYDCLAKQMQMQCLAEKRTAMGSIAFDRCIEETGPFVRRCRLKAT